MHFFVRGDGDSGYSLGQCGTWLKGALMTFPLMTSRYRLLAAQLFRSHLICRFPPSQRAAESNSANLSSRDAA